MRIGIDTGGTFTDLACICTDGILSVYKVPSTPSDPSMAVLNSLRRMKPAPGFTVIHGTTVATNALLERRGAKAALITTQGCRDVLEIARQTRDVLYSLSPLPRDPLIPRHLRYEVPERLDWRGEVVRPLDKAAVERVLDDMVMKGVESLAVCLLFSFLRPEHEMTIGRLARARGLPVSLSCQIAPEYREYERTATVCANAYVAPVMGRYIDRLQACLVEEGAKRFAIMQSNGGILQAEEAAANAIQTVLSGPAGGLVAAARMAREAGVERVMTFDMGGTSTDVALIDGELPTMRTGEVAGLPLLTPMLDIHSVGAGGGSLARRDVGGGLRVGPQSAGADPGPVAYGRGNQITVTDAHVLLGRLPAGVRLAGSLPLDRERVRHVFQSFGEELGLSPELAAEGVLAVINAQMTRALRHISIERGRDPAGYTLVAYGGAGGLHACELAEAMGIASILIPRYPGAFSALGLALADVRREYVQSLLVRAWEEQEGEVQDMLRKLQTRAREDLKREKVSPGAMRFLPFVEARYKGQSYTLHIPFARRLSRATRAFHATHHARYGYSDPSWPVEVVTVGLTAIGVNQTPIPSFPLSDKPGAAREMSPLWWAGHWIDCPLYLRSSLAIGQCVVGPALILQEDATTYLPPRWQTCVDSYGNLQCRRVG